MKKGYTLIEFLVVLGILAVAIGSSLVFLTTVLRGTGEANISAEVKQNGQAVLDTLDSQIRNATNVTSDGTGKHIILSRNDALPLHIKCFSDVAPKSENGWIGTVESSAAAPSTSLYSSLTNRNPLSGADVNGCSFEVLDASVGVSGPPVVKNPVFRQVRFFRHEMSALA